MIQPTGRALKAPLALSAALRCLPLHCLIDAAMMILELLCLWLGAKCSLTSAARHVWYDRFDREKDQEAYNRCEEGFTDFLFCCWPSSKEPQSVHATASKEITFALDM